MSEELQTCIYNHIPHECDHAADDAEYHARTGKPDCGQFEPECTGNCYSLTESGGPYIDPKCPKHGKWVAS